MVILLAGSSPLGRGAIATKLIKEHEQWRHLALEDLEKMPEIKHLAMGDDRDQTLLRIACQCALEMEEQGFHLLISGNYSPETLAIVRDELGDEVIPVHIGPQHEIEQSHFPHRIDGTKATVDSTYKFLLSLMQP